MENISEKLQFHTLTDLVIYGVTYILAVHLLRAVLRGAKAVQLKTFKLIYNVVMSAFSLWCFIGFFRILMINWQRYNPDGWRYFCDPEMKMMEGMDTYTYVFYMSKYVEYLDTVFLILAQKSQIDVKWVLHVYHHFVTPSISWSAWHYPTTSSWLGPLTNSFVHVIMYAYYAIALVNHGIRGWSHWVTTIQVIQFIIVLLTLTAEGILGRHCIGNIYTFSWLIAQYSIFLILFLMFFYNKSAKQRETAKLKLNGTTTESKKAQ